MEGGGWGWTWTSEIPVTLSTLSSIEKGDEGWIGGVAYMEKG